MFFIKITESAYENLVCCYISTFGNDIHREYSNIEYRELMHSQPRANSNYFWITATDMKSPYFPLSTKTRFLRVNCFFSFFSPPLYNWCGIPLSPLQLTRVLDGKTSWCLWVWFRVSNRQVLCPNMASAKTLMKFR